MSVGFEIFPETVHTLMALDGETSIIERDDGENGCVDFVDFAIIEVCQANVAGYDPSGWPVGFSSPIFSYIATETSTVRMKRKKALSCHLPELAAP
jgi:hypothetical protein